MTFSNLLHKYSNNFQCHNPLHLYLSLIFLVDFKALQNFLLLFYDALSYTKDY